GVATLGFTNGIVKYIAEHEKDKEYLKRFISTIFVSIFFMITVLCIFIYVFASTLSHYIFGVNFQFVDILIIFGLVLPLYATSQIIISIINGLGAFKKVIYINIIGNLLGLIITVGLIYYYKTFGALLAVVLIPSVLFFVSVFFIQKKINLAQFISLKSFDFSLLKPMSEYSLMTLVSVVLGSTVYLNIRKIIIETLDIKQAGYWEALSRISNYYFLFLTTILTVYFLPKLSKSNSNKETKSVFLSYYKEIFPFFFIGLILVFVL
ncbi:MAG TPA: O-antigen translocase, partial [Flavobacterium sp.]|nr:O-antigen translocase [Flavobacterium sp.]